MSANNYSLDTTKKQRQFQVRHENNHLIVKMYNTDIVKVNKETNRVTLNTNGFKTSTTKAAINNALKQLGSNLYVHQIKFQWFVTRGHQTDIKIEFTDYMTLGL